MSMDSDPTIHGRTGVPVDIHGGPTVDPTKNVLDLVRAEAKRQDDLRDSIVARIDGDLEGFKKHACDLISSHDKRYEQRYEASQKALEAAFQAQKDAINAAFAAQKEAINAALTAQDRAVSKSESAVEKRFEATDRVLAQLAEQQRLLMPRVESVSRSDVLSEKIGVLEGFRTEQLSRGAGSKEGYGWAIGVIATIVAVVSLIALAVSVFRP